MSLIHQEFLPGVWHIQDALGVCATLLVGSEKALLVDTGYGLENLEAQVRSLIGPQKPLQVLLTHGHHDHALGSRWFSRVYLAREEMPVWQQYTGEAWRRHVLEGAEHRGLAVNRAAYLAFNLPPALPLPEEPFQLGELTARVIPCPGHTPGSLVVHVPERSLLLTGDDWNPCTWLFFPEALPFARYRDNLTTLMQTPFDWVLCPHRFALFPRAVPEAFVRGLWQPQTLSAAADSPEGAPYGIHTRTAQPAPGQQLVFDAQKAEEEKA